MPMRNHLIRILKLGIKPNCQEKGNISGENASASVHRGQPIQCFLPVVNVVNPLYR